MEHFRIYPLSVITMQKLTDKNEILLEPITMLSEALQEVLIKAICNVKAESVYIKLLDPICYAFQDKIHYLGIIEVQFNKVKVTLPALIPKSIVIVAVAAEIDMEPIFIW